jgi:hypothetical protein
MIKSSLGAFFVIGTAVFAAASTQCPSGLFFANNYAINVSDAESFQSDKTINELATSVPVPTGYIQTYSNVHASTIDIPGYLGYFFLSAYDTNACAYLCDGTDTCIAFNLYFERSPTLIPGANCLDPTAVASVKCALYNATILANSTTNYGQMQYSFDVVMAGSNGYVTTDGKNHPGMNNATTDFSYSSVGATAVSTFTAASIPSSSSSLHSSSSSLTSSHSSSTYSSSTHSSSRSTSSTHSSTSSHTSSGSLSSSHTPSRSSTSSHSSTSSKKTTTAPFMTSSTKSISSLGCLCPCACDSTAKTTSTKASTTAKVSPSTKDSTATKALTTTKASKTTKVSPSTSSGWFSWR